MPQNNRVAPQSGMQTFASLLSHATTPAKGSCLKPQCLVLLFEDRLVSRECLRIAAATDALEHHRESAPLACGGAVRLRSMNRVPVMHDGVARLQMDRHLLRGVLRPVADDAL